jgi:GNAT superfamily N-acetyltransferase
VAAAAGAEPFSPVMKSSRQSRAIRCATIAAMSTVQARAVPAAEPPATDLVAAMIAELHELYGDSIFTLASPTATPEELSPPGGAYVALFEDGNAVAGGGVKRLGEGVGELKRMYVVPEARGRGLSRVLLAALEDQARDLGFARLRLDTGPHNAAALVLYPSAGYAEIADYNGNPHAIFWGEKTL